MKKQPKCTVQKMIDELQSKPVVVPEDLDNQILSNDPVERLRQLDQQAQEAEERISRS